MNYLSPSGLPDQPVRNIIPAGTSLLLIVTILAVAAACGLGGYALALSAQHQAIASGYVYWQDSSFDDAIFPDLAFLGGSAWVKYIPGAQFSVMFLTAPEWRGGLAFALTAAGGLTGLLAAMRFRGVSRRHPGLGLALILTLMGFQSAFDPPPGSITASLSRERLVQGDTAIALDNSTGFGTFTHNSRHDHGTDLYVTHAGSETNLVRFTSQQDAQALANALQGFTNSSGAQF